MSNKIKRIIKRDARNIYHLIESIFYKKDSSIVVMGSWFGTKFADNPRFLYQYLFENKEKLGLTHVIWVTRSDEVLKELEEMGYECYMLGSKESIKYHKLAKYHICNNNPNTGDMYTGELDGIYSFRAKRINLWHGVGLKGVGYASNLYKDKYKRHPILCTIKEVTRRIKPLDLILYSQGGWDNCYYTAASNADKEIIKQYFNAPDNKYIVSGYPRNLECLKPTPSEKVVLDKIKSYSKSVLYLPTFRENKHTSEDMLNLSKYSEDILKDKNVLWIEKPHSASKDAFLEKNADNVLNLDSNFDINVLLPYIDILITDYSSVSMDAICHNKAVIYYVPDYDDYVKNERGFVSDPDEYMAGGPKVSSIEQFKTTLSSLLDDSSVVFNEKYKHARKKYWKKNVNYLNIWESIK